MIRRAILSLPFVLALTLALTAAGQNPSRDLVREAEAGNVDAELKLAQAYQFGNGVPKDMQKAVRWYQKAAHDGNAEAAYLLGTLAYNGDILGDGIRESLYQAWAWFEVAKVLKYPAAADAVARLETEMSEVSIQQAHELATWMFMDGSTIPQNSTAALVELEWLQQHGSYGAKLLLGDMYTKGFGVPKDLAKAREFCNEAAKKQIVGAGSCLGKIFAEQNDQRAAFESFKKDAQFGSVPAIFEVAQRLKDGRGTKSNPVEALAWVIRAESWKATGAAEMRIKFSEGMSWKQLAEANQKAETLNTNRPVRSELPRLRNSTQQ